MATDKAISELAQVTTPLVGDELFAVVQNGETKQTTLSNFTSSGVVVIDTYVGIATIKTAGTLLPGALYIITDAGTNKDQRVAVTALSTTELSLHGSLIAQNADYQNDPSADYGGVAGSGNLGIWNNTLTINYTGGASGQFKLGETISNTTVTGSGILISDTGNVMVLVNVTGAFGDSHFLLGGTSSATGQIGPSSDVSSALDPVVDDIVIYNGLHWINTLNGIGSAPPFVGSSNWDLIPRTDAGGGYITEVDFIEYDFDITEGTAISPNPAIETNGWIQRRTDRRGNDLFYSKLIDDVFITLQGGNGFSAIDLYRWGSDTSVGNSCNEAYIDNRNDLGRYYGNNLERASRIIGNIGFGDTVISSNRLEGTGCIIDNNMLFGAGADIAQNILDSNTRIVGNVVSGIEAEIDGNTLRKGAEIVDNIVTVGAEILKNNVGADSTINNNVLAANGQIDENSIGQKSHIDANNIGPDCFVTQNVMEHSSNISQNEMTGSFGQITFNLVQGGAIGLNTISGANSFIKRNAMRAGALIINNILAGDNCLIESNNLSQNADIDGNTLALPNAVIRDIGMGISSSVTGNTINDACRFENNTIGDDAKFDLNILEDGANFTENTIGHFIEVKKKTLKSGFNVHQCHFGVSFVKEEDIDVFMIFKRCEQGFSNFEGVINLAVTATSADTVNLANTNLPPDPVHKFLEIAGIIVITNSPTAPIATITKISNFTDQFPREFRAEAGLTVTMTRTPVLSAFGDKFTIEGTADFEIFGRINGSDFITFRNDNGTITQVSAAKYI